jgi:hypothetical protein
MCRFGIEHDWRSREIAFKEGWALAHVPLHVAYQLHNNIFFENQVISVVIL